MALLLGRKPEPEGTLSSHFEISGSADDPRGQLALDVAGASVGQRFPPTDARVEVDLSNRLVDARVRVVRRQHALLALTAHLGAGLDALGDLERIASAPLEVKAVVGPLALQRLGLPASERQPPRVLKGKVHADLTLDGTLRAPRLVAHAQLQDIFLDKALVGAGTLEVNYASARPPRRDAARLDERRDAEPGRRRRRPTSATRRSARWTPTSWCSTRASTRRTSTSRGSPA